jgi:hypothetical protein
MDRKVLLRLMSAIRLEQVRVRPAKIVDLHAATGLKTAKTAAQWATIHLGLFAAVSTARHRIFRQALAGRACIVVWKQR